MSMPTDRPDDEDEDAVLCPITGAWCYDCAIPPYDCVEQIIRLPEKRDADC